MSKVVYNALKLSVHRKLFHQKKVLVVGSGAVGSYLMEFLAKLGVSPDAVDFDTYTLENAAKHSCLIRSPEDAGSNKAQCAAKRVQPLLDEDCCSNGVDADLCYLGPEAFSDYCAVFVAVDNFDAKVLLNELIRSLPKERRPIVIMDGTFDEMAQSVILDNTDFCLRCLIGDDWMKDSSIRTSCVGPQIRQIDGVPEIVRTSNLASSMAAHLSMEQFRNYIVEGDRDINARLTYTAYPHLELSVSHPMKKRNCPGCAVIPPKQLQSISGAVMAKTLGETLAEIGEILGTPDFEILVHHLNYRKVVHAGFVVNDHCRCCGLPIQVNKHEGHMYETDLICKECSAQNRSLNSKIEVGRGTILHAFTNDCEDYIKHMTLYELGFPLGAHIQVIQRNNATDFLDDSQITTSVFYCSEDHCQIHLINKL